MHHEKVMPYATYAPWKGDEVFEEVYAQIEGSTLVDKYRCYELWSLVAQSAKWSGALIEVGVWRGGTGMLIAKQAALQGIQEPVYLCDTFSGVVKAGPHDSWYKGGEHADTSVSVVKALQKKMKVSNIQILKGVFPEESATGVKEDHFRFCHIDCDVYESAKGVIDWIWERVVVGGIIVFDDYGFSTCGGVTQYVNEFKEFGNLHFIHNLNGHAILIKTRA